MKTTEYIALLFFTIILCGCSKSKSPISFEFDKVERYSLLEKDSTFENINQKRYENLTLPEKLYLELREYEIPTNINDTLKLLNLEKISFQKTLLSLESHDKLREILNSDSCSPFIHNACAPDYKDIYIFKNKSKIVAVAKVCFQCEILYFVDYKTKWQKFGDCVDFETLKKIK